MRDRLIELRGEALAYAARCLHAGHQAHAALWRVLAEVCELILGAGLC